jgi:hypothetical protein
MPNLMPGPTKGLAMTSPDTQKRPSAEFRLLAACMSWPQSHQATLKVKSLSGAHIDWDEFVALTARHRVAALAQSALQKAGEAPPPEASERLAQAAHHEAMKELTLAGEVLRLNAALQKCGLTPILLKGVGIALQGFGRLGLRNNRDIDILISSSEIAKCADILTELGYQRIEPDNAISEGDLSKWPIIHKDMVYINRQGGSIVEVHWRLFDNPHLMPVDPDKRDHVSYGGREISVLPLITNIIYLCAHGAQHSWSRLKWLVDLSVLLTHLSEHDFAELARETKRRGLGPLVSSSTRLCVDILEAPVPESFLNSIGRDWQVNILQQIAHTSLIHGGSVELEDRPWGSTLKNLSHYLFKADMNYWASEIKYDYLDDDQSIGLNTWQHMLGRVPRWINKHSHLREQERAKGKG